MSVQELGSMEEVEVCFPVSVTYNSMMLESMAKRVKRLAESVMGNCGCAHEAYLDHFSMLIDEVLNHERDEAKKATILYVAREYDYLSREEVCEMKGSCLDAGLCVHGIDPGCCPAGCGG